MSYNIAVAVLGDTAQLIIETIIRTTGTHTSAGFYLSAMALVRLLVVRTLKERNCRTTPEPAGIGTRAKDLGLSTH